MFVYLAALTMLALPSGALLVESTTQSDVLFVPVDGGPPVRIAPEGGAGYGRRQGSAHVLAVHPKTGGVLLGWTPSRVSGGSDDLFYVNADGRFADRPIHLLDGLASVGPPVFSPDGRVVLAATEREIVEFDLEHSTSVVLGRIPAPPPEGRLPKFMALDWSTATPAVQVAEAGIGLRWRLIDRASHGVALLDQRPVPKPSVVPGVPRWQAIPDTLDLVRDTDASPRTIHRRFPDGTVGRAVGVLEAQSPIRGVVAVPGSNTLTWYRGRSLLARDYGLDTSSSERVLVADVGDALTHTVTAGPRACVILDRKPPLSRLAIPVDGSPPVDLASTAIAGVGLGVADGLVVYRSRGLHRYLVSTEGGPPHPVTPPLPGGALFDAWSPARDHYVWQTTSNDPDGNDLWTYPVGAPEARRLATGGAGIGGFAGEWLLVDRSPDTAPDMVRLDLGEGSLRPSGLPAGLISMAGRASPPAWLGLSNTGELWQATVEAGATSNAVRLATGLDSSMPLAVRGTRAIVRQPAAAGGRLVAVETAGPDRGRITLLTPPLADSDLTRYGEPISGRLFVREQVVNRAPPVRWLAVPLDGSAAEKLPDLASPGSAFLVEADMNTPATNEAGDAALLIDDTGVWLWREGHPAARLAAVLPGPSPDPMLWDRPDTRQPVVLGWPMLGPTAFVLLRRGPELLLADTRPSTPTLRAIALPAPVPTGLISRGRFLWAPDGRTLAGADGETLAIIDVEDAMLRLVSLGPEVAEAQVLGCQPDGAAVVVWVATRAEARLISVPTRGPGNPRVLAASTDKSIGLVDFFGPGADWTRRRAPTLRNGVGLTWFSSSRSRFSSSGSR